MSCVFRFKWCPRPNLIGQDTHHGGSPLRCRCIEQQTCTAWYHCGVSRDLTSKMRFRWVSFQGDDKSGSFPSKCPSWFHARMVWSIFDGIDHVIASAWPLSLLAETLFELCNYRGSWLHWICGESCHCRDLQWTPACHGFSWVMWPCACFLSWPCPILSDFSRHSWSSWSKEGQPENSWGQGRFGNFDNFRAIFSMEWYRNDALQMEQARGVFIGEVTETYVGFGAYKTFKDQCIWMLDCRLSTNNLSIGFLNNDAWVATANMKHIASVHEVGAGDIWHHVSRLNGTWMWEEN